MEPTLGGGGGGSLANDTASSYSNESALELGLSLCSGGGGGGGRVVKGKGSTRGEYGRILTAKDFGSGFPGGRVCGGDGGGGGGVLGTKRGAECVSPPESGSASSVSQVVGWPPIRAHRMNSLVSQTKTQISEQEMGVGGNEKTKKDNKKMNHGSNNESLVKETGNLGFVKVNMDGLPIGRKVDLNSHACYESLARAIEEMFFKPSSTTLNSPKSEEKAAQASKLLDGSSEFVLTYEDKEGDWMLVGDVPWGMFLSNTVRRLRIMKTSEANGLAPRCQENLQFSKKTKEN